MSIQVCMRFISLITIGSLLAASCVLGTGQQTCARDSDCAPIERCAGGFCQPYTSTSETHITKENTTTENNTSQEPSPQESSTQEPTAPDREQRPEQDASAPELPSGVRCINGQTRPCSENVGLCKVGQQTCKDNRWGLCVGGILPGFELCDEKDNDCDGEVDEDFSDKGQPCENGEGVCKATGTWLCKDTLLECNAQTGTPQKEACDGKDNDCNGKVDELQECGLLQGRFAFGGGGGLGISSQYRAHIRITPTLQTSPSTTKSSRYTLHVGFAPNR